MTGIADALAARALVKLRSIWDPLGIVPLDTPGSPPWPLPVSPASLLFPPAAPRPAPSGVEHPLSRVAQRVNKDKCVDVVKAVVDLTATLATHKNCRGRNPKLA
ncbi:hypothetical protein E2C01_030975 [Portunus trituberculatus]|uniref:Uncharacterized protein n=1 Tax=Portunus trituberculatus TaxID=210409 RepID=A0A5B7EYU5_PORTR|nr:hypothetical protein [Portunus trituberculatus]